MEAANQTNQTAPTKVRSPCADLLYIVYSIIWIQEDDIAGCVSITDVSIESRSHVPINRHFMLTAGSYIYILSILSSVTAAAGAWPAECSSKSGSLFVTPMQRALLFPELLNIVVSFHDGFNWKTAYIRK